MEPFKNIHIGNIIRERVAEQNISLERIEKFLQTDQEGIEQMYNKESLDAQLLLQWSKLLDYNLFLYYHSHLQLYTPSASTAKIKTQSSENTDPLFRKNLYTKEVKDYILELIKMGKMTSSEVMKKYSIPKATLFTWMRKQSLSHEAVKSQKPNTQKKKVLQA